jgi:hypothetical protein
MKRPPTTPYKNPKREKLSESFSLFLSKFWPA